MLYNKNFIYFYLFLINSFINFATCEGTIPSVDNPYTSKIIGISLFIVTTILFLTFNTKIIIPDDFDWTALTPLEIPLRMSIEESNRCHLFTLMSGKIVSIPVSDIPCLVKTISGLQPEASVLYNNILCTKVFISSQNYYAYFNGDEVITLALAITDGRLQIHHADLISLSLQLLAYVN